MKWERSIFDVDSGRMRYEVAAFGRMRYDAVRYGKKLYETEASGRIRYAIGEKGYGRGCPIARNEAGVLL